MSGTRIDLGNGGHDPVQDLLGPSPIGRRQPPQFSIKRLHRTQETGSTAAPNRLGRRDIDEIGNGPSQTRRDAGNHRKGYTRMPGLLGPAQHLLRDPGPFGETFLRESALFTGKGNPATDHRDECAASLIHGIHLNPVMRIGLPSFDPCFSFFLIVLLQR